MKTELYEDRYDKKKNFSFGKNWNDFLLSAFDGERLEKAKESLIDFLGGKERIQGKTFVDIGCGSGIFSLAAHMLGAKMIVSVDIDEDSISCVRKLHEQRGRPNEWQIVKGSALDEEFLKSLGQFDIVYSWGVLHHTGDMNRALLNVTSLMSPGGVFYLAIYNRSRSFWIGTSPFWRRVKRSYNQSGNIGKKAIFYLYSIYFFLDSLLAGKNPFARARSFKKRRGMSWKHNVLDWLGGYPYEYASPEEIVNLFAQKNIFCEKIANGYGLGCAEYLLRKL